jgi:ABC-type hemin transport system ATPase subunit
MESELKQVSGSVFALIGPQGATNFTVIKNRAGASRTD